MKTFSEQSGQFQFSQATAEDGPELLKVLEENDFKGAVSLLYTRRPDPYLSFMGEALEVYLLVGKDKGTGTIAAIAACAVRQLWLQGTSQRVGYLFGLRVAKAYQKRYRLLAQGYAAMGNYLAPLGIEIWITTILEENIEVKKMLEKPRIFMPQYHPLGRYQVTALAGKGQKSPAKEVRRAREKDRSKLLAFYEEQGRQQDFFADMKTFLTLPLEQQGPGIEAYILVETRAGEVVGAAALWDQRQYKQYRVVGYQGILKWLYPMSGTLAFLGIPYMPEPGNCLELYTLAFVAIKDQNQENFVKLVKTAQRLIPETAQLVVGFHENHKLNQVVKKFSKITYTSCLYQMVWPGENGVLNREKLQSVGLECALL